MFIISSCIYLCPKSWMGNSKERKMPWCKILNSMIFNKSVSHYNKFMSIWWHLYSLTVMKCHRITRWFHPSSIFHKGTYMTLIIWWICDFHYCKNFTFTIDVNPISCAIIYISVPILACVVHCVAFTIEYALNQYKL